MAFFPAVKVDEAMTPAIDFGVIPMRALVGCNIDRAPDFCSASQGMCTKQGPGRYSGSRVVCLSTRCVLRIAELGWMLIPCFLLLPLTFALQELPIQDRPGHLFEPPACSDDAFLGRRDAELMW